MGQAHKETLRTLSAAEERMLEAIVKASSERVDRVRRALAVLVVAEGGTAAARRRRARPDTGVGRPWRTWCIDSIGAAWAP